MIWVRRLCNLKPQMIVVLRKVVSRNCFLASEQLKILQSDTLNNTMMKFVFFVCEIIKTGYFFFAARLRSKSPAF